MTHQNIKELQVSNITIVLSTKTKQTLFLILTILRINKKAIMLATKFMVILWLFLNAKRLPWNRKLQRCLC